MKDKTNLKIIVAMIVTAVISISGTVLAQNLINANQINYTKNGNDINVKEALDNLYDNIEIKNTDFGTSLYASYNGTSSVNNNKSLNLPKGKYILILTYQHTWVGGSYTNTVVENPTYADFVFNYNSDNCSINNLSGYYNRLKPTSGTQYIVEYNKTYFAEIKSQSETITISIQNIVTSNEHGEFLGIQAIPINR